MVDKSWCDMRREKQRVWRVHIWAWAGSGLSQAEYCRHHKLNKHCFGYLKKKFADEPAGSPARQVSSFVVVPTLVTTTARHLDRTHDSGVAISDSMIL